MRQRALSIEAWPLPDRIGWQAATAPPASFLDEGGSAAHLAPSSRFDLERRYAYFLDWAHRHDRLPEHGGPAATVTPENVADYLKAITGSLGSVTVAGSIGKLHRMASLLEPSADWAWLNQLAVRLSRRMVPIDKAPRVVETRELYGLGLRLMAEAEDALAAPRRSRNRPARRQPISTLPPSFSTFCKHRDGLMIALLAACPARRGNLTELEVGPTIVRRAGGWSLEVPGHSVKTRRALVMPVPEILGRHIDRHLTVFRAAMPGAADTDHVWLSRLGRPLSASSVYNAIATRTEKGLGKSINPHLFRDCLVTTVALGYGAHIRAASAALGHVDERITTKHYNQASMVSAVECLQAAVLALGNYERDQGSPPCAP
jgi:integrase